MPTFSSEALQAFKEALSSSAVWFFGFFRKIFDFILSSPVLFFAVALPVAGLVFWMIFCLIRSLVDRDMGTSMGTSLYSRELDGAFTNGALITRNAFRKGKKLHDKRRKSRKKQGQGVSSDASESDDLYRLFGVTRQQMRNYHTRSEPYKRSIHVGDRDVLTSKLDVFVDDEDL